MIRLVYVVPADPGALTPDEALDRWPTARLTLEALAAADPTIEIRAVLRTRGASRTFERAGVEYVAVADDTRSSHRLARAVAAHRPTVVHLNGFGTPLLLGSIRAAAGRHRPRIVVQHHGGPPPEGRTRVAARAARTLIDVAMFTGADHGQATPFEAAGLFGRHTALFDVLESASDLEPVDRDAARRSTRLTGDPAVLWIGRLNDGKDPLTALRAFEELAGHHHGATLTLLAGSHELAPALRHAIDASPLLRGRVDLVGPVPHADVASWASAADIVLSTSRHEGSGYSLIEAITCGCTPVVTDIPPHRSIVGSLGATFAAGDPGAAAAALGAAAATLDRAAALDHGRGALAWPAVASQLLRAYRTQDTPPNG